MADEMTDEPLEPTSDQPLTEREKAVALLIAEGVLQKKEVAARLKIHPNTLTQILKRPHVQAYIDQMQSAALDEAITDLHEAFNTAAPEAYRTLTYLAKHAKSEQVRLKAAAEILDRAGNAPKRTIHGQAGQTNLTQNNVTVHYLGYDAIEGMKKLREIMPGRFNITVPDNAVDYAVLHGPDRQVVGEYFVDADGNRIIRKRSS